MHGSPSSVSVTGRHGTRPERGKAADRAARQRLLLAVPSGESVLQTEQDPSAHYSTSGTTYILLFKYFTRETR